MKRHYTVIRFTEVDGEAYFVAHRTVRFLGDDVFHFPMFADGRAPLIPFAERFLKRFLGEVPRFSSARDCDGFLHAHLKALRKRRGKTKRTIADRVWFTD